MKKIFNTLLLFIALTACQGKKIDMALHLEKGKEYSQNHNSQATVVQDINGLQMNVLMLIKGGMSCVVVAVNPHDYDLEVKYTNLSMTMELPSQGKIEFSSNDAHEQDIFSTLLSKMIGKTFNVTMAKNGKILEVKNIESLIESLFEEYTTHIPEEQLAQIKEQITKAYGAEAFKGNIEMTSAIFPDKPVNKGDTWTITTNLQSGIAALITTEYELADFDSTYAIITGNSVIKTEDTDIEANDMPVKYDVTGSMISEIKINKETGWIVEANIKQEIKGDAYVQGNSQLPNGIKIPMIMETTTTITGE